MSTNPTRTRVVHVPSARPVVHPLRDVGTATWSIAELPHGRRRVTIDHAPLPGVAPADLLWWFTHLDGSVPYAGGAVPRYLAWHPLDHIHWELACPAPGGGAGEGARFRIVERFGAANPVIDVTERVEKLDASGIRLVQRRLGVKIFQLEHTWSASPAGAHYVSVMDIGAREPWLAPFNRWLTTRAMPAALCEAWVRHNIEEVGQLEFLLPSLLAGTAVTR